VNFVVRRVCQMEGNQISSGMGSSRKTKRETIKKNIEINELKNKIMFDRTLWRRLIHLSDPTLMR